MSDTVEREFKLEKNLCVDGVPQYHRDQINLTIKIMK